MRSAAEIKIPQVGKYIRYVDVLDGGIIKTGKVVGYRGAATELDTGEMFNYDVGDRITYYADKPYRDRDERKRGYALAAIQKSARENATLKRRILTNYMFVGIGVAFGILIGLAF